MSKRPHELSGKWGILAYAIVAAAYALAGARDALRWRAAYLELKATPPRPRYFASGHHEPCRINDRRDAPHVCDCNHPEAVQIREELRASLR